MIDDRDKDDHKDDASRYLGGISNVVMVNIEDAFGWNEEITEDADFEIIEPKQLPQPKLSDELKMVFISVKQLAPKCDVETTN